MVLSSPPPASRVFLLSVWFSLSFWICFTFLPPRGEKDGTVGSSLPPRDNVPALFPVSCCSSFLLLHHLSLTPDYTVTALYCLSRAVCLNHRCHRHIEISYNEIGAFCHILAALPLDNSVFLWLAGFISCETLPASIKQRQKQVIVGKLWPLQSYASVLNFLRRKTCPQSGSSGDLSSRGGGAGETCQEVRKRCSTATREAGAWSE